MSPEPDGNRGAADRESSLLEVVEQFAVRDLRLERVIVLAEVGVDGHHRRCSVLFRKRTLAQHGIKQGSSRFINARIEFHLPLVAFMTAFSLCQS